MAPLKIGRIALLTVASVFNIRKCSSMYSSDVNVAFLDHTSWGWQTT